MSMPGVGAVTALAYLSTIVDPSRFSKPRTVGVRKLAVILHRMLVSGEEFRWPPKRESATA